MRPLLQDIPVKVTMNPKAARSARAHFVTAIDFRNSARL